MQITVPVMLNLGVAFLLVAAARAAPPIQVALLSPVDCKVSSWSTWSACGEKCVPHADGKKNVRTHTRRVLAEPQNGGLVFHVTGSVASTLLQFARIQQSRRPRVLRRCSCSVSTPSHRQGQAPLEAILVLLPHS